MIIKANISVTLIPLWLSLEEFNNSYDLERPGGQDQLGAITFRYQILAIILANISGIIVEQYSNNSGKIQLEHPWVINQDAEKTYYLRCHTIQDHVTCIVLTSKLISLYPSEDKITGNF